MSTNAHQMASVVHEARRWLGTPYHHRAAVLGGGVDCAQFILQAFVGAGIEDWFDPGNYTHDWHLHRSEEKYLETVEKYMERIDFDETPLNSRKPLPVFSPASVLMFRVGRTFSHGVIVTEWPRIIHSYFPSRMVEEVDIRGTPMAAKPMRAYSYWGT